MKHAASYVALIGALTSPSAFATDPCKHISLKKLQCQIVDSVNHTKATIVVSRSVTAGGDRPDCSTGVIQEALMVYQLFQADAGEKIDLLFSKTHLAQPFADLEHGHNVTTELYSVSSGLKDVVASISLIPTEKKIDANLTLSAVVDPLFAAKETHVNIIGSGTCTLQR